MSFISECINVFLHLDKYLGVMINNYGILVYLVLFLIILFETGLVVTPFLPGDSLLFAAGAFAALGYLNIWILLSILIFGAIAGDTVNYNIGKLIGKKIIEKQDNKFIKKQYIEKTNFYFDKYGCKTIIISRFIPIVRTCAPFVAGIGYMKYSKFLTFNAIGGVVWVTFALFLGFFFGNIPFVAEKFSIVTIAIILISILPLVYEIIKSKLDREEQIS